MGADPESDLFSVDPGNPNILYAKRESLKTNNAVLIKFDHLRILRDYIDLFRFIQF